jgi:hypothetical protein
MCTAWHKLFINYECPLSYLGLNLICIYIYLSLSQICKFRRLSFLRWSSVVLRGWAGGEWGSTLSLLIAFSLSLPLVKYRWPESQRKSAWTLSTNLNLQRMAGKWVILALMVSIRYNYCYHLGSFHASHGETPKDVYSLPLTWKHWRQASSAGLESHSGCMNSFLRIHLVPASRSHISLPLFFSSYFGISINQLIQCPLPFVIFISLTSHGLYPSCNSDNHGIILNAWWRMGHTSNRNHHYLLRCSLANEVFCLRLNIACSQSVATWSIYLPAYECN